MVIPLSYLEQGQKAQIVWMAFPPKLGCHLQDLGFDADQPVTCVQKGRGKDERVKFETDRESYSKEVQKIYDEAQTYHDGKWVMFEPVDTSLLDDFIRLLNIKRKPNRK